MDLEGGALMCVCVCGGDECIVCIYKHTSESENSSSGSLKK